MQRLYFILILQFFVISAQAIVGGVLSQEGDIISKSTVSLRVNGQSFCTGTLITDQHVITAAHCIRPDLIFSVAFGINGQVSKAVNVQSVTVHEGYTGSDSTNNPVRSPNDIAIIKLIEQAPDSFQPVSIAENIIKKDDMLILAGFGLTQFFNGESGDLKYVITKLQSRSELNKEFIFGKTPGRSACKGDSGGPAYISDGEKLLLAGVTSRGITGVIDSLGRKIGCVGEGFYTDVLAHKDWILEHL